MLDHPVLADKDEVALGALDIVGFFLVDELDVLLEVGLSIGPVPAQVADVLLVVGVHVAER